MADAIIDVKPMGSLGATLKRILLFIVIAAALSALAWAAVASMSGEFSQPRDALLKYSPEYATAYRGAQVLTGNHTTQSTMAELIATRDWILKRDWADLIAPKLLEPSYWESQSLGVASVHPHKWAIRDDFFRLVDAVGGPEAMMGCTPIVRWSHATTPMAHYFDGVRCRDVEYKLRY